MVTKVQSRTIKAASGRAHAAIQADTPSLILPNTEMKLDSFRLKILVLRSFQRAHMTSSARLRIAFHGVPAMVVILVHHSSVVFAMFQFDGFRRGSWTQIAIWSQILRVKRQSTIRCKAVSIVCLHRAQVVLCGHP